MMSQARAGQVLSLQSNSRVACTSYKSAFRLCTDISCWCINIMHVLTLLLLYQSADAVCSQTKFCCQVKAGFKILPQCATQYCMIISAAHPVSLECWLVQQHSREGTGNHELYNRSGAKQLGAKQCNCQCHCSMLDMNIKSETWWEADSYVVIIVCGVWKVWVYNELRAVGLNHCGSTRSAKTMAQICANLRDMMTEDLKMPHSYFA